ncbi:MAG: inositol monophosphatase family protein [Planctomycetota bacterium]
MNDAQELEVARAAVREAARLCARVQAGVSALEKADKSPVTVADFGSQALVCAALADAFPRDPVVGEEDSRALREHPELLERVVAEVSRQRPGTAEEVCAWIDRGASREQHPRFWTVDPIDGTKGFLRGEHYAVALALIEGGELQVSAVAAPGLEVVFSAVRGAGAWVEPLAGGAREPLRVSACSDPAQGRLCQSVEQAHSDQDLAQALAARLGIGSEPRRLDSLAKYGLVARGDAEIYLRLPRPGSTRKECIWDHAAGVLLVTEAGGRVTDTRGRPWPSATAPPWTRTAGWSRATARGTTGSSRPFRPWKGRPPTRP